MRIRKNAKNSGFLYPNANLSSEADKCLHPKNLCELNQSPWDIITFPSSDSPSLLHQFDNYEVCYNVNYAGNGSSSDSIGDFESVASKTSRLGKKDNVTGRKNDYNEVLGFKEERKTNEIEKEIKLCDKLDNKGWQCGSVVKNGNTMCDSHLSEIQNYAVWTTKRKSGRASGPTTGCRPHRAKKRPTTNPHEFYYYSGFGPSWGKKRGTVTTTSGIDDDIDVQEETGKRFKPEMSEVGPMELDYFDDYDSKDDGKKGKLGITRNTRGRKPVKERSLKSLM